MAVTLTLPRPLDGLKKACLRWRERGRALVRTYPREAVGVGVLGFVGFVAIGTLAIPNAATGPAAHAAPPAPPPLILQPVAPQQALKVNSEIPLANGPNPAAAAFIFNGNSTARAQALQCLASAVYYEAGNQDEDGARAVAQVVLNRVRHPAFPNTVCGVVYEGSTRSTGCQFTFTCDGSLTREPDAAGWRRARTIAEDALSGAVYAPVGWATHYHADYVLPTWASSMAKNAVVGDHLFYRWSGSWGQSAAFTSRYTGHEPNAAALRTAALSVPHVTPVYGKEGELAKALDEIPGAQAIKLAPSMRGDKRVSVRFNLVAREASKDVATPDYTKKFELLGQPQIRALAGDRGREPATARKSLGSLERRWRQLLAGTPRTLIAVAVHHGRSDRRQLRSEGQLNPQPDAVEPSVDRETVARQDGRRGPLPPCHRQRRERSGIAQRVAILQAHHGIVEGGTAVEHRHAGVVTEAALAVAARGGEPRLIFRPVKAQRVPDRGVDRIDVEMLADRVGSGPRRRTPDRQLTARRQGVARGWCARPDREQQPAQRRAREQSRNRPARPPWHRGELLVELQRVARRPPAAKFAIRADDVRGAAGITAFPIGVMLLDQALVGLVDRGPIGTRSKPENGECGSSAGHRRSV